VTLDILKGLSNNKMVDITGLCTIIIVYDQERNIGCHTITKIDPVSEQPNAKANGVRV
jgi:hypothetical protein